MLSKPAFPQSTQDCTQGYQELLNLYIIDHTIEYKELTSKDSHKNTE